MIRRALLVPLLASLLTVVVTTTAGATITGPVDGGQRAGTPETGATIDRDDGEADDPSTSADRGQPADPSPQPADDPDVHDPVEAARSDRSIGSWVLVGAALLAAAIGFGVVFNHTRERHR